MAEKLFLCDINLNGNQMKNVALEKLSANPEVAVEGRMFCYEHTDSVTGEVTKEVRYYDGQNWIALESLNATVVPANVRTIADVAALHPQGIPVGYTFEQFVKELFRNVLPPVNPSASVAPTVSLQITPSQIVEVDPAGGNDLTVVVSENQYTDGKIGTMSKTDGESVSVETRQNAGCVETSDTLKIYAENGDTQLNTTGESLEVALEAKVEGTTETGKYQGTVDFGASSATAKDSYGVDKTDDFKIAAGTTAKSAVVGKTTLKATYYVFCSGTNSSAWTSEGSYPQSNVMASKGLQRGKGDGAMYYTFAACADGEAIMYFPSHWTINIEQFGTDNNKYATWGSANYQIIPGFKVALPCGGNVASIVEGTAGEGEIAYSKLVFKGLQGAQQLKITLS